MQHYVFHTDSCTIHIDLIISPKADFCNPAGFLKAAIQYLDKITDPGEDILADYDGAVLKEGNYTDIVKNLVQNTDLETDMHILEVQQSFRIKFPEYEPLREEFVLVSPDEYVMFAWSSTE